MNTCLSPLCVDERRKVYKAYSTQYMSDNSSLTYNVKTQLSAPEILEFMMGRELFFSKTRYSGTEYSKYTNKIRSSSSIWIYTHLNPETSKYASSDYIDNLNSCNHGQLSEVMKHICDLSLKSAFTDGLQILFHIGVPLFQKSKGTFLLLLG